MDGCLQAQASIHLSSCEAKAGELARVVEHRHLAGEEAVDALMYVYMNEYIICVVLWIQITEKIYLYVTSEKAYILVYAHTYIHTSCTLLTLTFIWICIRYNSSLGVDVVIMCIIFCITFCIVAFNFAAICIFTCGPTWKLLTDISKWKHTPTYIVLTYILTYKNVSDKHTYSAYKWMQYSPWKVRVLVSAS